MAKGRRGGKRNNIYTRFPKAQEDFMTEIVEEVKRENNAPYDPQNTDIGLTNSDIQAMVEAFAMTNGLSFKEENDLLGEINKRISDALS